MESSQCRETRWSVRKSVSLDLDIFIRDQTYYSCITRDLSLGGMYVEFNRLSVKPNEMVDVTIRLDKDGEEICHRFCTRVAHISESGIGLAFKDFGIEDFRVLQHVLQMGEPGLVSVH